VTPPAFLREHHQRDQAGCHLKKRVRGTGCINFYTCSISFPDQRLSETECDHGSLRGKIKMPTHSPYTTENDSDQYLGVRQDDLTTFQEATSAAVQA